MAFQQILKILLQYRRMIVLLCASATLNAIAITYMIPEKYESRALLLLKPREQVRITPPVAGKDLLNFPVPVTTPFEAMAQTYSEFVKSRTMAERLVETLHLDREPVDPRWWKRAIAAGKRRAEDIWLLLKYGRVERSSAFEKAIEDLDDSLTVNPTKGTYVFEIKHVSKYPETAASVANAVADIFLELNSESNRTDAKGSRQFLEKRLRESEDSVATARLGVRRFKETADITLIDSELSAKINALSDLQSSLATTREEIDGTRAEITQTESQLKGQELYLKSSFKVTENPIVTDLNAEVARLEVDLAGRLKKVAPTHPDALLVQAKIDRARTRLSEEVKRIVSEETSAMNTVHQRLLQDLLVARSKLQGLQAREKATMETIESNRRELRRYPEKQAKLARLELDLAVREDTFKLIAKEYEDARIREDAANPEIRVLSRATPALHPIKPIKVYYAGLALALALTTGVACALFLAYWAEEHRQAQAQAAR